MYIITLNGVLLLFYVYFDVRRFKNIFKGMSNVCQNVLLLTKNMNCSSGQPCFQQDDSQRKPVVKCRRKCCNIQRKSRAN